MPGPFDRPPPDEETARLPGRAVEEEQDKAEQSRESTSTTSGAQDPLIGWFALAGRARLIESKRWKRGRRR